MLLELFVKAALSLQISGSLESKTEKLIQDMGVPSSYARTVGIYFAQICHEFLKQTLKFPAVCRTILKRIALKKGNSVYSIQKKIIVC